MGEYSGEAFQKETKYRRGHLAGRRLDWSTMPETYKRYAAAPRVELDPPDTQGGMPLWSALQHRRSVRGFSGEPVTKPELSQLLWAMQGITRITQNFAFRTAPSAGGLYPIETYVVVHEMQGLAPGIYHYAVETHALEQLQAGDFRAQSARAAMDQRMCATADVVFVWTAVFARSIWKYGQRAYRYIYLDAGHTAQNLALAAVSLGLGSCQIAALYDDEVNQLVGVDGESESVLYMSDCGPPREPGIMTNHLALETSPYLLQHAHNPVDWYPWGEEALQQGPRRGQADLPQHRLLGLPLVPRHGARVVRGRGRCRASSTSTSSASRWTARNGPTWTASTWPPSRP